MLHIPTCNIPAQFFRRLAVRIIEQRSCLQRNREDEMPCITDFLVVHEFDTRVQEQRWWLNETVVIRICLYAMARSYFTAQGWLASKDRYVSHMMLVYKCNFHVRVIIGRMFPKWSSYLIKKMDISFDLIILTHVYACKRHAWVVGIISKYIHHLTFWDGVIMVAIGDLSIINLLWDKIIGFNILCNIRFYVIKLLPNQLTLRYIKISIMFM